MNKVNNLNILTKEFDPFQSYVILKPKQLQIIKFKNSGNLILNVKIKWLIEKKKKFTQFID